MRVKDYRIGNWVRFLMQEKQIIGISKWNGKSQTKNHYFEFNRSIPVNQIHIRPIELTAEWLDKFGFETKPRKLKDGETISVLHLFTIQVIKDRITMKLNIETYNRINVKEIKYVHELQNICYDLGEELKIVEHESK